MSLAVLCPGQGAQHAGMLAPLAGCAAADAIFDAASEALGDGPREWLDRDAAIFENAIAQPLICIVQLAAWAALRDKLPAPRALAGYSVGELACYGLADALDAATLARLARVRATLMDAAASDRPGGLLAIRGIERSAVATCCEGLEGWVAIRVDAQALIVGGTRAALAEIGARASRLGAKTTALRVGIASHTSLMAGAVAPFRAAIADSPSRAPRIPVVGGIDGSLVRTRERMIDTLVAQIAHPIDWGRCIDTLRERGCTVFLEMPPGRTLCKMVRDRYDDVDVRAVEEFRDLEGVVGWVRSKLG